MQSTAKTVGYLKLEHMGEQIPGQPTGCWIPSDIMEEIRTEVSSNFDMACNNQLAYSANYLMDAPKAGFEDEFKSERERADRLAYIISIIDGSTEVFDTESGADHDEENIKGQDKSRAMLQLIAAKRRNNCTADGGIMGLMLDSFRAGVACALKRL